MQEEIIIVVCVVSDTRIILTLTLESWAESMAPPKILDMFGQQFMQHICMNILHNSFSQSRCAAEMRMMIEFITVVAHLPNIPTTLL